MLFGNWQVLLWRPTGSSGDPRLTAKKNIGIKLSANTSSYLFMIYQVAASISDFSFYRITLVFVVDVVHLIVRSLCFAGASTRTATSS